MPHPIRAWGPALLWATVLFLLSAVPGAGAPGWVPVNDKVAHLGLYAVLGATLALGRRRSRGEVPHAWLLALGILYGATDEWHQMYVPGRSAELADWLADIAGVVLGYGTTQLLLGRTRADDGTGREGDEDMDTRDDS